MKTIKNNKLIAEFMGLNLHQGVWRKSTLATERKICKEDALKYHEDWNWLMVVVEKIESLGYKIDISKWENSQYCGIYLNGKKIADNETNTKIEAVYNACIEFIKWYITQNK